MKRIVAYIYRYKKDNEVLCRQGNMGFCRVEQNGERCVVVLCLKDNCGVEGTVNISALKKNTDLVECERYCKLKLNRCHVMCAGALNVRLDINVCDGICVECGGRMYVALWKECAKGIELVDENVSKVTEGERIVDKEQKTVDKERKSVDDMKNAGIKNSDIVTKCHENNQNESTSEKWSDNKKVSVTKGCVNKKPENIKKIYTDKSAKYDYKTASENVEDFTRIYNRLCKVRMILDGAEYPAVKLKLHELVMLPRVCWRMANNIFLMEGYYRYGHILFMQYEGKYILAVPWEQKFGADKMAKQCGFARCVAGYEYGKEHNCRQYWIKFL